MTKRLVSNLAAITLLEVLAMTLLFHLLVLIRIIPLDIIWGGNLKDISQVYVLETVSVIVTAAMMSVVMMHAGMLTSKMPPLITSIALWIMLALFLLNSIGNWNAQNPFEKKLLTPVTLLLCLLCGILLFTKNKKTNPQ